MPPFGVIECFYGLPYVNRDRVSYSDFLKGIGFQFYIYGPKGDESLRRNWKKPFSTHEREQLKAMHAAFDKNKIQFGIALSPQGLYTSLDQLTTQMLEDKIKAIDDIGAEYVGLFFDDMKSSPDMAQKQIEIIQIVEKNTRAKIVFCPSYYCYDSLLDLLFGDRPKGYLETLGAGLSSQVEILWTGEDIISQEISASHLRDVAKILKRKPFLCDNFYANDGPINCEYLRLAPPTGRERDVFSEASAWAFNPMNQAHLSKIAIAAVAKYALEGLDPINAFERATFGLATNTTVHFILENAKKFVNEGLSNFSEEQKLKWQKLLPTGDVESDLIQWLSGHYTVGIDSIVDQSGYDD